MYINWEYRNNGIADDRPHGQSYSPRYKQMWLVSLSRRETILPVVPNSDAWAIMLLFLVRACERRLQVTRRFLSDWRLNRSSSDNQITLINNSWPFLSVRRDSGTAAKPSRRTRCKTCCLDVTFSVALCFFFAFVLFDTCVWESFQGNSLREHMLKANI